MYVSQVLVTSLHSRPHPQEPWEGHSTVSILQMGRTGLARFRCPQRAPPTIPRWNSYPETRGSPPTHLQQFQPEACALTCVPGCPGDRPCSPAGIRRSHQSPIFVLNGITRREGPMASEEWSGGCWTSEGRPAWAWLWVEAGTTPPAGPGELARQISLVPSHLRT